MSDGIRYLLDTNVLSEVRKKQADANVLLFFSATDAQSLYISVLSLGELKKGIVVKQRSEPDAGRRLAFWVEGLEASFADRILGIDAATTVAWGEWSAQRSRPVVDTLLAATAFVHGLTLATRNTRDVQDLDVPLVNPWKCEK